MSGNVMLYEREREPRDFGRMRERAVRRSVLARCWTRANAMFNHMVLASKCNSIKHLASLTGKPALANRAIHRDRDHSAHPGTIARLARLTQTTGGPKWAES